MGTLPDAPPWKVNVAVVLPLGLAPKRSAPLSRIAVPPPDPGEGGFVMINEFIVAFAKEPEVHLTFTPVVPLGSLFAYSPVVRPSMRKPRVLSYVTKSVPPPVAETSP